MLTFKEYIDQAILADIHKISTQTLMLEMPHILVGGNVVDLELELHATMKPKDFIQYIQDWVDGKPTSAKHSGFNMVINSNSVKEFAKKVLAQSFLKNFTLHHYDEDTWGQIETILQSKLV